MIPQDHETFEHEADIGVRGFGRTVDEAFANAAAALFSVMIDPGQVREREFRGVNVQAGDRELLLVEWLNALLTVSDIERMVFSRFEVRIEGNALAGTAWGEHLDRRHHATKVEVKAATMHQVSVRHEDGRFVAQCVVDV